MNNRFWGEPDDIEPLPDWMNPNTYKDPFASKRKTAASLEKVAAEALKRPIIPTQGWNYKDKE